MSGHTPTPWSAVHGILRPDDEGHPRSFVRPVHSQGYQIAQTTGPNGPANAALIVEAVNSHHAMRALLETCRRYVATGLEFASEEAEARKVLEQIDAILAPSAGPFTQAQAKGDS